MIISKDENIGIKVNLGKGCDYPVVCETLERIGIVNRKEKKVYPSCYCMETNDANTFIIAHFKELFVLQGKKSTFEETDKLRLQTICYLMDDWGLINVVDKSQIEEILHEKVSVLSHRDKNSYKVIHKFRMNNL